MAVKKDIPSNGEVSILSSGVKIEGKLYSEGNVRIDGTVIGDVTVNGNLTLGDTSELKGELKAKNITMSGKVDGKVIASEKLILESKSKLTGDLFARILVIQEGALFDGTSTMSGNSSAAAPKLNEG